MTTLILTAAIGLFSQAEAQVVNVPYPLSPEEAARDFLRLVDRLQPAPWKSEQVPGEGPYLLSGVLLGKTRAPDGACILMMRLPNGEAVLIRSPSMLPELAIDQRAYMVVAFDTPEGQAVARLLGVVLSCDLGKRAELLDQVLGIGSESEQTASTTSPPTQPPTNPQPQSPAAQPTLYPSSKASIPQGNPPSRAYSSAPNTFPTETPEERERVEFWKAWIAQYNSKLSEAEREAIVRWVLYYSEYYAVDHRLVFAVMKYESNFDPNCVSRAGAIGLMQLMPSTARHLGVNPWVVEENIKGGIQELAEYLDKYAGRSNFEQCALALACYNAGPNRVARAGGIPNIPETTAYVRNVTRLFYELVTSGAP